MLRPRVTKYVPVEDLGAVLPRGASGCVGCRRKGNTLVRITGIAAEIKAFERHESV